MSGVGLHLLVVMRLGNVKARDHLVPLLACSNVERITLIRHAPVEIDSPKLNQMIHRSSLDQGVERTRPLRSLKNLAQCLYHGVRIARRELPDAVIGFNFTPYGVVAWAIARLSGNRAVVSLIGTDFHHRLNQRILGAILRRVLKRCDRATIFSETARQGLIALGVKPERAVVLPNTVDTQRFQPDPAIKPIYDLIYSGYLRPGKGVDQLLYVLERLNARRGHTTLLLVGDGVERKRLQTISQEIGVAGMVSFYGWSENVAPLLKQARVFVLLSEAEGLPMAMLEAMSTGLPVVVTDVGANREVVQDGWQGHLVSSPADPDVVADCLLRLLDDQNHYDRCREGALRVSQKYGYDSTTRSWEKILSGLTRDKMVKTAGPTR